MSDSTPSPTEQMLIVARQVAAGQASASQLQPMLGQLHNTMGHAIGQFTQDGVGNPEVSPEVAERVLNAMAQYRSELERMNTALSQGDMVALQEGANSVEAALKVIRSSQQAYQEALETPHPTPFPYINRLLRHLDYFLAGGGETRHTLILLQDYPEFIERTRTDLQGYLGELGEMDAVNFGNEALADLQKALGMLQSTMYGGWTGETLQQQKDDLLQATMRLTIAFGAGLESEMTTGASPVPFANLVLKAAEGFQMGAISASHFVKLVETARDQIQALVPEDAPVEMLQAVEQLQTVLEWMHDAGSDNDPDAVGEYTQALLDASFNVGLYVAAAANPDYEEDSFVDFVVGAGEGGFQATGLSGLPGNLQSVIDVGMAYTGGTGDSAQFLEAIDGLEQLIKRFRSQAAKVKDKKDQAGVAVLEQALNTLSESVECLRTAHQTRDRRAVDTARGFMTEAADLFSSLQAQR